MQVFYGRIGWMESYCGLTGDNIKGGGSYNKDNQGLRPVIWGVVAVIIYGINNQGY